MPVSKSDFSAKALVAPPRRRIALGQRERRLKLNTNHTISKHILDTHPHAFHRLGRLDWHPRPHQTQAWQKSEQEAAPGQPARLQMGLCRIAQLPGLQGGLGWVALRESGRRLHQPGMPHCGSISPDESPQEGLALCLPVLSLHPPCRFGGSQEYQLTNACHPARLDGNGAVVSCP